MKKAVFVLCFLFVIVLSCKTKNQVLLNVDKKEINYIPYYLKVYEADSLYLINDFAGSYKILDSLFKIYEPLVMDNYYEYGIYLNSIAKTGNSNGIREKVEKGFINYGGIITLHKEKNDFYDKVIEFSGLKEEEIKNLKLIYQNNLNLELREDLLNIYKSDQKVRNGNSSKEEIKVIDSINTIKLEHILKIHGLPKKKDVGSLNAFDLPGGYFRLVIVFLHQTAEFNREYLPMLLENVKSGNLEPEYYAMIYDRILLDTSREQLYGSFECVNCELINESKLDSIRSTIGLPHKNYYQWKLENF